MLSTHTLQARTAHGALAALEDLSLEAAQAKFLPLQNETREQYTAVRDIPELISQCQVAPTKIPELMPQIFQKLQPSLEILFPPEPSPA
jgi:hypothetical protein